MFICSELSQLLQRPFEVACFRRSSLFADFYFLLASFFVWFAVSLLVSSKIFEKEVCLFKFSKLSTGRF